MMAYMGTVIVILLSILIAQMSTTYTQAKRVARLEYDVDRILLLTRMERFPFLVCLHVRGRVHTCVECLRALDSNFSEQTVEGEQELRIKEKIPYCFKDDN